MNIHNSHFFLPFLSLPLFLFFSLPLFFAFSPRNECPHLCPSFGFHEAVIDSFFMFGYNILRDSEFTPYSKDSTLYTRCFVHRSLSHTCCTVYCVFLSRLLCFWWSSKFVTFCQMNLMMSLAY